MTGAGAKMKRMSRALIIFIKNPEKGKVKTRLAQTVGNDRALQIYQALLEKTRTVALAVKAKRFLFYSQWINELDNWSGEDFDKRVQEGNSLGDRMKNAFGEALKRHAKGIIIGSDCPLISKEIIEEAYQKLDDKDFVLGPALDGGYYLLGMKTLQPAVFEDMEWSTDKVLEETIKRIKALQASYYGLPALPDIDYEEDWEKYGWKLFD